MARGVLRDASRNQGSSRVSRSKLERGQGNEHPTSMEGPLTNENFRFFGKGCWCGGNYSVRTPYHFAGPLLRSFNSPSFMIGDIAVMSLIS